MRTIALISQKGGVGKTTLAINLAAAAQRDGLQAVIADTDPQQSTYEWYRGRKEEHPLPYVAQVFPENIGDVIDETIADGAARPIPFMPRLPGTPVPGLFGTRTRSGVGYNVGLSCRCSSVGRAAHS